MPNANQYWYQKAELSAFCHFGPNTFNEIEWGEHYGDKTPDEIFKLETDFDADTMVKTLKDAGFKMLIVTAKHHDGFCIWNSAYTEYDVANTSYKNGQGDILAELSAACTQYNMDMGLYLSPWDIHDPSYGYYKDENKQQPTTNKDEDLLDYNEYYNNQLKEILSNPIYGNNGRFREVWMDGAKGSGANAQEYNFQKWFDTIQTYEGKKAGYDADCMLFGAEAYTTVRWIGNENGYAADDTWSKSRTNKTANSIDSNSQGGYTVGYEDGNQWTVPECDARITSGWFWGTTKNTPKTITALADMYFRSVGHNGTLLLNVPPNNQGTVDEAILQRVTEFGENVTKTFDYNLAKTVQATNVRGNDLAYKPGNTIDGNDDTYWTTDDGTNEATLLIDLDGAKSFDVVSIEEAIQNGQRINQYKVEYKDASGQWQTLESGQTIGAKRLVRTNVVKGTQVRITVSTPDGKVPMISEVGVYKASDGFELPGAAPTGMNVIDISDTNAFQFGTGWTDETGSQFIGGTNKWANAKAEFTVRFTGSKIYLLGTKDPNHGTATVSIDDGEPVPIDTSADARSLGQIIFESDTLSNQEHTLTLTVTNKAIGIEAAYVINNDGKGMVGLEQSSYTMNENETMTVNLVRVGGTEPVTVKLSPNPGSAIQDDFNTELNQTIVFGEGEMEKTATVQTKRNTNVTGDRYFTIELSSDDPDVILGFNESATVTIKDSDVVDKTALQTAVDAAGGKLAEWYTAGWEEYAAALQTAQNLLKQSQPDPVAVTNAKNALETAVADLVARTEYSDADRVPFPWQPGSSYTLEAEFAAELKNVGNEPKWYLQVDEAGWASNGKYINCLNTGDSISFPYVADRTGTYTVTASYRSGDPNNSLAWSEEDGKITSGTVPAGAGDEARETHTVTFDIEVTEAGPGTLVFTGPAKNSPQLDKLVITPKNITYLDHSVSITSSGNGTVTSNAQDGTISETEDLVLTIEAAEGYRLGTLTVNGDTVTVTGSTYTVGKVTEDVTVTATFVVDIDKEDIRALVEQAEAKHGEWYTDGWEEYAQAIAEAKAVLEKADPTAQELLDAQTAIENAAEGLTERETYSAADPFQFPSVVDASSTLEAEFAILNNSGEGEAWPLQIAKAGWASHGEFINCLNQNDTITFPFTAEKAGTYTVKAYYRSGDTNNSLAWSGENVTSGTKSAGAGDSAAATHTVEFEVEITKAGAGTLVFTGPEKKSPQLDKLEISLKKAAEPQPVEYTVTFDTNGGFAIPSASVAENDKVTKPENPTKDGFEFDGWYTDEACENAYNFDTPVTSNFTLYAKWTAVDPDPDPTVTVDPDPDPTVSVDPDPDPTVTVDPDPDPTVTVDPDPDPTVTVDPDPDPTVTVDPDPDPTVTVDPDPDPTVTVDPNPDPTTEPTQQPQGDVVLDNNTDNHITAGNASEVFEPNTVITVESVAEGEIYTTVEQALEGVVADMKHTAILDITATLNGTPVQPSAPVQMTFAIPQHLSADNLKLFYVSDDGKTTQEIPITVDKEARTVTASIAHFSTYVLANVVVDETTGTVPPTGDASQLMVYVAAMGAAALLMGAAVVAKRRNRG